jgi:hypothetical protein
MLDTQNQTLITIACVCVNVTHLSSIISFYKQDDLTYVKDEGANLNTLASSFFQVVNCEPL